MQWIAPSGKNADNAALKKCLWDAADQLCVKKPNNYHAEGII